MWIFTSVLKLGLRMSAHHFQIILSFFSKMSILMNNVAQVSTCVCVYKMFRKAFKTILSPISVYSYNNMEKNDIPWSFLQNLQTKRDRSLVSNNPTIQSTIKF